MNLRLFIDFWNFQINWNQRAGSGAQCDWSKLPAILMGEAQTLMNTHSLGTGTLHETRVYASYEPANPKDRGLKNWLNTFLDKQPGINVISMERRWKQKAVHCKACNHEMEDCPSCGAKLGRAAEKMVDSRIVTDLLDNAWSKSFDIAILLTSDADMVPAVECLQKRNLKVINATWNGHGHELQNISWASFQIDNIITKLKR